MESDCTHHPTYNDEATPSCRSALGAVTLRAARHVLYLAMLFFRVPLRMIGNLTIIPLMVGAVAWGLIAGWTSMPALLLAAASFGMFIVSYLYDTLLLLVAPEPLYLDR
jgi:hypothetical protein